MAKQVFSVSETKGLRERKERERVYVCVGETPCVNSQARDSPTRLSRSTIMLNN